MPGYSNKPLYIKIGIANNSQVVIKNTTQIQRPNYESEISTIYPIKSEYHENMDIVHVFVDNRKVMETELLKMLNILNNKNIAIWISWPKKASKLLTDITEDVIRDVITPLGLVDVKVCSVSDDIWSGLKIVIRLEKRI